MLSAEEHLFTGSELEFLESVGHIVGVAIENVKFYNRERSRLTAWWTSKRTAPRPSCRALPKGCTRRTATSASRTGTAPPRRSPGSAPATSSAGPAGGPCSRGRAGRTPVPGPVRHAAGKQRGEALHVLCPTAGGEKLPTALTSAPIRDASGEETGRVNVFRDITRAKEIDRMKTDFVRTVSHELRTPLSAIVGMTEMLMDGEIREDKAAQEYLETIHTEGQRLASMVEELLDIARIESGRQEIRKTGRHGAARRRELHQPPEKGGSPPKTSPSRGKGLPACPRSPPTGRNCTRSCSTC